MNPIWDGPIGSVAVEEQDCGFGFECEWDMLLDGLSGWLDGCRLVVIIGEY
jgi:hypothetical protein